MVQDRIERSDVECGPAPSTLDKDLVDKVVLVVIIVVHPQRWRKDVNKLSQDKVDHK